MATSTKTITYAWPMNTGIVADAVLTSLGDITIYIPENSAGAPVTFRSVTVEAGFQDIITATGGTITEHRVALTLNGATATTITDLDDVANSGENLGGWMGPYDFTSHFSSNFGTVSNKLCNASVYYDQSTGTTLGMRNCTAMVNITYEYSDTSATQIQTVCIPLESPTGALSTTAGTEIGTSQIPILTGAGGILPESGIVIRDYFFVIEANEATTGTPPDFTLSVQIDSETAVAFGAQEQALASARMLRWIYSRNGSVPSTTSAHQFKLWSTGLAAANHPKILLYVTYEFTLAGTTRTLRSLMLPVAPMESSGYPAAADALRGRISFEIADPGTITLRQSALSLYFSTADAISGMNLRAGSQAYRAYTNNGTTICGGHCVQQRVDSGGAQGVGISIARGTNTFTFDWYGTDTADIARGVGGFLILNYECDVASQGIGANTRTIKNALIPTDVTNTFHVKATGKSVPIVSTDYRIVAVGLLSNVWIATAGGFIAVDAKRLAGEGDATSRQLLMGQSHVGDSEIGVYPTVGNVSGYFRRWPGDVDTSRLDITAAREYWAWTTSSTTRAQGVYAYVTLHSMTWTRTFDIQGSGGGSVSVDMMLAASDEKVKTGSRTGNGTLAFTWYDNIAQLYGVAREDATHVGRSDDAVAS